MSETDTIENDEVKPNEEEKQKIVLPKLDNVDDQLLGDRAAAVIEHIVQSLVENKDKAEVEVVETGDNSVELHVHTDPQEIGRVIGKKGRVVQAMRRIARAIGSAEDINVGVEVIDPNRPPRDRVVSEENFDN
ncbi:MAG: KH domain-containing protein [Acidimicrobiia bacterium]